MRETKEILTHATHVNGWERAVYMSCMSQNFRLFHLSNLSVRNFRFFSAHVYGATVGGRRLVEETVIIPSGAERSLPVPD